MLDLNECMGEQQRVALAEQEDVAGARGDAVKKKMGVNMCFPALQGG